MDTEYRLNRLRFYLEQIKISTKEDSFLFNISENNQIQEKIDELENYLTKKYNNQRK